MLLGQALELVVVDGFRLLAHPVGDNVVHLAGEIQRVAVSQVAAVRQAHAQQRVAGFQHRQVDGLIGLAAGMRLDIGVFGAKELLGALDGEVFRHIHILAAAVVTLAGQALSILVGHDGAQGFQHRLANEILGGDQLHGASLPVNFQIDGTRNFRVHFAERTRWT